MKVCGKCSKQWPDDTRFCPIDGTALGESLPTVTGPLSTLIGQVLNRTYKIEAKIGKGGMGAVFRARHLGIGDVVALKVISPEHTQNSDTLARFRREAQAARRLNHPNAVAVHDFNITEDGLVFMVMEYVNGETVEKHLQKHAPLTPQRALEILRPVAAALDVAHSLGIIHRDLKPANLMLCQDSSGQEQVKVLDFGTVRLTSAIDDDPVRAQEAVSLTHHGQIFGTPLYMSPEQVMSEPTSAATDIYSLGVILYQMLTGTVPFAAPKSFQTMMSHVSIPPEPPSQRYRGLPEEFDSVVLKSLEKNPADRYTSAGSMVESLAATLAKVGPKVTTGSLKKEVRETARPNTDSAAITASIPSKASGATDVRTNSSGVRLSRVQLAALQEPNFDQYVGRENELKRLQEEYNSAIEGKARPIFIIGSPGTGKTQLTFKIREWAGEQGALVLTGKFFDYGGNATEPLRMFKNLLIGVLPTDTSSGSFVTWGSTGEQLRKFFGLDSGSGPSDAGKSEAEKWQVFDMLTKAFSTLSQTRQLLLVLDDLQWADALSLEFLGYLLRNTEQRQFFFIGTARAEEANSKGHPFREWLMTQTRYLYYERIELGAFDKETINKLLQSIFHFIEINPKEIDVLYKITDGNPFYLVEVIRLLMESQKITFQKGVWRGTAFDEVKLPDTISNVVRYKLESCPEELRELLAQAAVIGDDFRFELLEKVSGLDEEDIEKLLATGVKAFLICEESNALGDDYRFYNSTIRRVIYDDIPKRQRRRLHSRVAAAIIALHRGKTRVIDGALVYHFHAANEWEQAIAHGIAAIDHAWQQQSMDEVLRFTKYVEEAMENLSEGGESKEQREARGKLKLRAVTATMRLGRFPEAEREAQAMREYIESLGNQMLLARWHLILSELCYWGNRHGEGVAIALQGLKLAREAGDNECARYIMFFLAWCQARTSKLDVALPIFQEVAQMSERDGDLSLQARALCSSGYLSHFTGTWRESRLSLNKALELSRASSDRYVECNTLIFLAWIREFECKPVELMKWYEEGVNVARTCGWRNWEGYLHYVAGRNYLRRPEPDLDQAEELLSRAMAIMQETADIAGQLIISPVVTCMNIATGRIEDGADQLRTIIATLTKVGETIVNSEARVALGNIEIAQGLFDKARESFKSALELAKDLPYPDCQWRAHYGLAQCFINAKDNESALDHLSQAIAIINKLQTQFDNNEEIEAFLENKQELYATYAQLTSN